MGASKASTHDLKELLQHLNHCTKPLPCVKEMSALVYIFNKSKFDLYIPCNFPTRGCASVAPLLLGMFFILKMCKTYAFSFHNL
uniref:Putative ovule protein n=1 Tax=Solanum chacoense TaxID=4108 RepID=A0A0V0HN77_SOLCH